MTVTLAPEDRLELTMLLPLEPVKEISVNYFEIEEIAARMQCCRWEILPQIIDEKFVFKVNFYKENA